MNGKTRELDELKKIVAEAKRLGKRVVFTNGCFDLIHVGHLHILREARKLGDMLIVAINSDSSVKKIKGPTRPIFGEMERAELLSALEMVDYVTVFDAPDPYNAIDALQPNTLVKGEDWAEGQVVGGDIVRSSGGKVVRIPLRPGYSTTTLIERIRKA